jgi:hypothetical protein
LLHVLKTRERNIGILLGKGTPFHKVAIAAWTVDHARMFLEVRTYFGRCFYLINQMNGVYKLTVRIWGALQYTGVVSILSIAQERKARVVVLT